MKNLRSRILRATLIVSALACCGMSIHWQDDCDFDCHKCDEIRIDYELHFYDDLQQHPGPTELPLEPHEPLVKLQDEARICPNNLVPDPYPENDDGYGWSVAISAASKPTDRDILNHGPIMVVGAPFDDWPDDPKTPEDEMINDCGAVYVYQSKSPSTTDSDEWKLIEKIYPKRKKENGNFGWDVGVITQTTRNDAHAPKNYIFVGQPSVGSQGIRPGAAFVYELIESAQLNDLCDNRVEYVDRLHNPHKIDGDLFGYSLDVSHLFYPSSQKHYSAVPNEFVESFDNLLLAIGAPGVDKVTTFSRFYPCLNKNKIYWNETVTISPPTPNTGDDEYGFGRDVAITLNKPFGQDQLAMIVGFPSDESAFVFEGSYSQWDPKPPHTQPWMLKDCTDKIDPMEVEIKVSELYDCQPDPKNDDHFGFSVDIQYSNGRGNGFKGVVAAVGVPDDQYCSQGFLRNPGSARVFERSDQQEWTDTIEHCLFIRPAGLTTCQEPTGPDEVIEPEFWCLEGEDMKFGFSIQLMEEAVLSVNETDYLLAVGAPQDPWYECEENSEINRGRVYLYGRPRHSSGTIIDPELNDTLYQVLQDYQARQARGYVHLAYQKQVEQEQARFGQSIAINRQTFIVVGASGHGPLKEMTGQVYLHAKHAGQ